MPSSPLHEPLLAWYDEHARDLPWRRADATPWSVMVSEFMLQQTTVARVLPAHAAWLNAWPRPSDLAAEPPGEAIRAWGRLGYPRRALRLHAAAVAICDRHDGEVPAEYGDLRALPGVGDYTAAAIASFAFGRRHAVLDTNVRRVLGRLVSGVEFPPTAVTARERRIAERLLPATDRFAARWAIATMELGALVCVARNPSCGRCPVRDQCAWRQAGRPPHAGPPRRGQRYAGTDRQCRGRLLAVLRDADGPVHRSLLDLAWYDETQRKRALDSLVADGLVEPLDAGLFALPSATT
jgi:A/G-specific adenine glycosylase